MKPIIILAVVCVISLAGCAHPVCHKNKEYLIGYYGGIVATGETCGVE